MKPGTRVVSHMWDMGEWEPDEAFVVEGSEAFLWVVPAQVAGRWSLRDDKGWEGEIAITQQFQRIGGTITHPRQDAADAGRVRQRPHLGFTFVDSDGAIRSVRVQVSGGRLAGQLRFVGNITLLTGSASCEALPGARRPAALPGARDLRHGPCDRRRGVPCSTALAPLAQTGVRVVALRAARDRLRDLATSPTDCRCSSSRRRSTSCSAGACQPYRGSAVTLAALRWYVHCTMTLVVRYSFLEFVTPSPFSQLYYRLMGMRIGRGVTLNSTAIADPSLIELGDGATIGGSANILAHYAQGGYPRDRAGEDRRRRDHRHARGHHGRRRGRRQGEGARQLVRAAEHEDSRRASRGPASRRRRIELPKRDEPTALPRAHGTRRRGRAPSLTTCPRSRRSACASLAIVAGLVAVVRHPAHDRRAHARRRRSIYDHLHVVTGGWNRWLHEHPRAANAVLDRELARRRRGHAVRARARGVRAVVHAVLGPARPVHHAPAVAGARSRCRRRPGIIWRSPGLAVAVRDLRRRQRFLLLGPHRAGGVRRDAARGARQIPALTVAGIVVAVLQVVAVIALRAHWTVDVVAGLAAAIAVGLLF